MQQTELHQLLATKFYIPQPRPNLVPRPRLMEQLNAGLSRKLSLVSAPAGYGKSTLLSEWVHQVGCPAAWLSLDSEDDSPPRFWAYFLAAVRSIPELSDLNLDQTILDSLRDPHPASQEALLAGLISEIIEFPQRFILVLDDLHLISEPQIYDGLFYLLEHMPPAPHGMHLAIAARRDPLWPIARLRVQGEITELRAAELRFTKEEQISLMNDVMKLSLSPLEIARLEQRTEGWIVGLLMAALSMQGREDVSAFLDDFSGSHRFVLDFLAEEVLSTQDQPSLDFLLKTSILERFTADLCDAVTGREDSQSVLASLEKANMFLVPLDDERRWYRYHHLFADLLRMRLDQETPRVTENLHLLASAWYEQNNMIAEAIGHSFLAGDMLRVAHLVEANAFSLLDSLELATLQHWMEQIPEGVRRSHPWLLVAQAWVLVYTGHLQAAEDVLAQAQQGLSTLEADDQGRADGHINAIRAYATYLRGQGEKITTYANRALELLPAEDAIVRTLVATNLGASLIQSNDLDSATKILYTALDMGRASGSIQVYMLATANLVYLFLIQGRLYQAEAVCRRALVYAHEKAGRTGIRTPAVAQVYAMLASVYAKWNDLDRALALAQEGVALNQRWGQADTITVSYVYLAGIQIARRDIQGATSAIEHAKRYGSHVSGWFDTIVGSCETKMNLLAGNLPAAAHWVEACGMDIQDEVTQPLWGAYQAFANVLIAQGKYQQAVHLLDRMIENSEQSGATGDLINELVLRSLALSGAGEQEKAQLALQRALYLAEVERNMLPFLEAGKAIMPLLKLAAEHGAEKVFAQELLSILQTELAADGSLQYQERTTRKDAKQPLVEPLSEREMDVLRLLRSPLSIPEIAQELYIATSTARTHVRNIYSKLGVHGRIEAIQMAEETGLI